MEGQCSYKGLVLTILGFYLHSTLNCKTKNILDSYYGIISYDEDSLLPTQEKNGMIRMLKRSNCPCGRVSGFNRLSKFNSEENQGGRRIHFY